MASLLENRVIALLQKETDLARVDLQIADIDAFIDAVKDKKIALAA